MYCILSSSNSFAKLLINSLSIWSLWIVSLFIITWAPLAKINPSNPKSNIFLLKNAYGLPVEIKT